MKILIKISIVFCLLFSIQLDAQQEITKKSHYLGGMIKFTIDEYNNENQPRYGGHPETVLHTRTYFAVNPHWIKDVTEYWQLGIVGHYSYSKSLDEMLSSGCFWLEKYIVTTKSHSVGAGLFLRYVFNPKNKLNFYLQPNINYNHQKNKELFDGYKNDKMTTFRQFVLGIGVGVRYKIGQRWRLVLSMGGVNYRVGVQVNDKSKEKAKFSDFKSNFDLNNFGLGFEYRL